MTTIKYRRLSPSGDYTFGQGQQNFISDLEAVTQAVRTRLELYKEAFWRDLSDGLPLFQEILGSRGSQENLQYIDSVIKKRIQGTKKVIEITFFNSSFDRDTRQYNFVANIQTAYSTTVIQGTV